MAVGDILATVSVPVEARGNSRGIAFDGTYFYSAVTGNKKLFKYNSLGNYVATYDTPYIYGALWYDKQTNTMWAGNFNGGWSSNDGTYEIYHIDMTGQVLETIPYNNGTPQYVFDNAAYPSKCGGVTIDDATDTLFVMPYLGTYVVQISKTGQYIGNFSVGSTYASGISSDGKDLYVVYPLEVPNVIKKFNTAGEYLESISVQSPPNGEFIETEYDTNTFAPKCALWLINATWTVSVLMAVEIDCGVPPRTQAITDLIEATALEQAAISHILNAEGERLQKVLTLNNILPEDILSVNKSVNSMVRSVTLLENIFRNTLEIFDKCLCTFCPSASTAVFGNEGSFNVFSIETGDVSNSTEYTTLGLKKENTI